MEDLLFLAFHNSDSRRQQRLNMRFYKYNGFVLMGSEMSKVSMAAAAAAAGDCHGSIALRQQSTNRNQGLCDSDTQDGDSYIHGSQQSLDASIDPMKDTFLGSLESAEMLLGLARSTRAANVYSILVCLKRRRKYNH